MGAAAPLGCNVVNAPPTRMEPSACRASDVTVALGLGMNERSSAPSLPTRARLLRVTAEAEPLGWSVVKDPPIRMEPLGWARTTLTIEFGLGLKFWSSEPSGLKRAMKLRVTAVVVPLGSTLLKTPPAMTLPSPSMVSEFTGALGFGL